MNLWSVAEAKMEDVAFLMVKTFPELLENKEFAGLTGKLVEMHKQSRAKKAPTNIFNLFKQKIDPGSKRGSGRFRAS